MRVGKSFFAPINFVNLLNLQVNLQKTCVTTGKLTKMSRQVDVKALVSHIVRGDGLEKCRICMGDTSQGQVYLGDTVMMEGDKAITLSELLEVITGVQVMSEDALPSALCKACYTSVMMTVGFRTLVKNAQKTWNNMLELIETLPNVISKNTDRVLANIFENKIYITEFTKKGEFEEKFVPINDTDKVWKKEGLCYCPKCDMEFAYPRLLYFHLDQSADSIRACPVCAKIMTRDQLIVHMEKHKRKLFSCKKCPALFLYIKPYIQHKKDHKPGGLTCGDCGRNFNREAAFHAHQSVHSQRSCPNCNTQFNNQTCYVYHIQKCCNIQPADKNKFTATLHNKQKVRVGSRGSRNKECICDYCNKTFAGKKFVLAHIQIVHTKETHRPCVSCGKLFAAAHMATHMKSHNQATYKCEQCGVIVKSKLGYKQHLRLHTGERPYPCQFCGEKFSASSRRSEHVRNKHKKSEIVLKHGCTLCPAQFRLPHKLKHHLKTVHEDGNQSLYECKECNERFASCRSLLYHSRKHNKTVK